MDYLDHVTIERHTSFGAFDAWRRGVRARLILLSSKANLAYTEFGFEPGDILLVGRESAGAPPEVHDSADACLTIPLRAGMRSLNVAVAAAMVAGEAARQIRLVHKRTASED
jgi:tRNA (cytidine/uridine-2'-O-)-methyltransferase